GEGMKPTLTVAISLGNEGARAHMICNGSPLKGGSRLESPAVLLLLYKLHAIRHPHLDHIKLTEAEFPDDLRSLFNPAFNFFDNATTMKPLKRPKLDAGPQIREYGAFRASKSGNWGVEIDVSR